MPANAAELLDVLKDCCGRLAETTQEQMIRLNQGLLPSEESQWQAFEAVFAELAALRERIGDLLQTLSALVGSEQMKALLDREGIMRQLAHTQVFTMEGIRKLESNMITTGTDLSDTKHRRKAMNAYYGMDRIDQEALFIDNKK